MGRDIRPTTGAEWLSRKDEFIRARDRLLDFAQRGTGPRYQWIVADWLSVHPARDGQIRQAGTGHVFESFGLDKLESDVHTILEECWEKIRELRLMFLGIRQGDPTTAVGLDLSGLTEKETVFIAAGRDDSQRR